MGDEVADAEERHRRGAGQHAVDRLAAALEWHAHPVAAFLLLEAVHVDDAWDRSGQIRERAGFLLRHRDQVVD